MAVNMNARIQFGASPYVLTSNGLERVIASGEQEAARVIPVGALSLAEMRATLLAPYNEGEQ